MPTLTTLTENEREIAVSSGSYGVALGTILTIGIVFYVSTVIATWKIFKKAGEPGWKCLIPIYNLYIMFKIVGMKGWFWGILLVNVLLDIVMAVDNTSYLLYSDNPVFDASKHIPTVIAVLITCVVSIWGEVLYAWRTSKVFGHGVGYFIGLLFLQPIFWLIIGFGSSKYHKEAIKA